MNKSVKLVVFHQGQTDWNVENHIQGSTDIPLNSERLIQAQELGLRLQSRRTDKKKIIREHVRRFGSAGAQLRTRTSTFVS